MSDAQNDMPRGDVVDANVAIEKIDQMIESFGEAVEKGTVRYQLSGSSQAMSRKEAELWIEEARSEGFSRIRFIVHSRSKSAILVELAASSEGGSGTSFHPDA